MADVTIHEDRDYGLDDAGGRDGRPSRAAALLLFALSFGLWSGLIATLIAAIASA